MRFLSFFLLLSFSLSALAEGWVKRVSRNRMGALVVTAPGALVPGESLDVMDRGTMMGKARFIRYARGSQTNGLIQMERGQVANGYTIKKTYTGARSYNRRGPTRRGLQRYDEEIDFGESGRSPAAQGSLAGRIFGAALVGYDHELLSEFIKGGVSFGLIGGYSFTEKISAGFRFGYSALSFDVPSDLSSTFVGAGDLGDLTSSTPSSGTSTSSSSSIQDSTTLKTMYLLFRGGFRPMKSVYVGPTLGFVRVSAYETAETHFAFGAEASYEYFFMPEFSLGGNLSTTYVFDDSETDNFMGVNIMIQATAWY